MTTECVQSTIFGRLKRRRLGPEQVWEEVPEAIAWRHIEAGGEESVRSGLVWAPAPPWRGHPGLWVREVRDGRDGPVWWVVRASKRHRCSGRRGGPGLGRWIDKGTLYTDVGIRLAQDKAEQDHFRRLDEKVISCKPLDDWLFKALSDRGVFETMFS